MASFRCIGPLLLLAAVAGCERTPVGQLPPDADPFGQIGWLLAPTQGRPALLAAGEQLPIQFRVPVGFAGRVECRLIDTADPKAIVVLHQAGQLDVIPPPPPLPQVSNLVDLSAAESFATAAFALPATIRPGLYDLTIALYDKDATQPLRVKSAPRAVGLHDRLPDSFRFVQLSNMNIGSATASAFPQELVDEVNSLAPAFIVTTGDYIDASGDRRDPAAWKRVKEYFARFDAPVFLLVGEHDDDESFARFVAPSRCGRISFGRCQGILLHDTYRHPIDSDRAQYQWLDSILAEPGDMQFNFLVTANDSLRVFDAWRKLGYQPRDYVLRNRIGLIFVGGYSDWDFAEYATKIGDAPVHYIRTHASSTCIRGKASGVPHYRIVQIDRAGGGVSSPSDNPATRTRVSLLVPENGPTQRALHSVPVGQVQVRFDGPNDGSAEQIKLTILNRLTVPLPRMRVKVRLKAGKTAPVAAGGEIERVIDRGQHREVWLRVDVPDLGVAAAVAGPADSLPRPRNGLVLSLLGDSVMHYRSARSSDGFAYFSTDGQAFLDMLNANREPIDVRPIVRLNGNVLSLRGASAGRPIRLMPGERRTLPIDTPLALASPGEHWLTVHLADDPLPFATRKRVYLLVTDQKPATTQQD